MTAPSTPEEWTQLADGFLKKWNFPNCVAAIDSKRIAIRKPSSSGSLSAGSDKNHAGDST